MQELTPSRQPTDGAAGVASALTQLRQLSLTRNKLSPLPEWLSQLVQLKKLHLHHRRGAAEWVGQLAQGQRKSEDNQLTVLPESFGALTQLRILLLGNNRLTALPESLRRCGPEIPSSCTAIGRWASRQRFLVRRGEEEEPAVAGTPRPRREYLDWYFQLQCRASAAAQRSENAAGRPRRRGQDLAGSYLIHNKPCDPGELPTEGINIDDWETRAKRGRTGSSSGSKSTSGISAVRRSCTPRISSSSRGAAFTCSLIDARAGEKESNIHYWLKIIQSYGGDSPVLVVVNKCDQHPHELNETRLMRDYPNIRGFVQTSCSTGQGIAELRREIGKQVRRLPHVFDELPEATST